MFSFVFPSRKVIIEEWTMQIIKGKLALTRGNEKRERIRKKKQEIIYKNSIGLSEKNSVELKTLKINDK